MVINWENTQRLHFKAFSSSMFKIQRQGFLKLISIKSEEKCAPSQQNESLNDLIFATHSEELVSDTTEVYLIQ